MTMRSARGFPSKVVFHGCALASHNERHHIFSAGTIVPALPPDVRRGLCPAENLRTWMGLRPWFGLRPQLMGQSPNRGQSPNLGKPAYGGAEPAPRSQLRRQSRRDTKSFLGKAQVGLVGAATILLLIGTPAAAHRLDEYLQATTIAVEKDRVQAQIRLTPGVEVFRTVLATIDTNADGAISQFEQRAYAESVLRDLSLTIDGKPLRLRLVSSTFPSLEEMKEGLSNIQIDLDAEVPHGNTNRRLIFENHHQSRIAAYLVNCLVPRDPNIQITAQHRNYLQSIYHLDYVQTDSQLDHVEAGIQLEAGSYTSWSDARRWWGVAAMLLSLGLGLLWRSRRGRKHKAWGVSPRMRS